MSDNARSRWILLGLLILSGGVFFTGINWGLPSRAVDPFLFGDHPVWSGAEIKALLPANALDPNRGADVDANPIGDRSGLVRLNETDRQRAEIVQRYRIQSYQPDEHITFRALAMMRPGELDLDPRLYQYGGLWIYPVGAMLKVASIVGLIDARGDVAFYFDHPEAFGRFYVVARTYCALWGLVGVACVYWIARRATGSLIAAAGAGVCFCVMPVVVNMAHEAKPHLPGAVLTMLGVIAAAKFGETGKSKWWVWAGVACGAAMGMVVSGALSLVILPVMCLLRAKAPRERIILCAKAIAIAIGVYVVTNPYVAINLVAHRERLVSNLSNSTGMYRVDASGGAVMHALGLIGEGTSPVLAIAGGVALIAALVSAVGRRRTGVSDPPMMIVLVVAGVVAIQFVMLAAGKPGEYGRFAILPDVALMLVAVVELERRARASAAKVFVAALLVIVTAPFGLAYLGGFIRDCRPVTSRLRAAEELAVMQGSIGLYAEPGPYSCPPVDLFERQIVLLPEGKTYTEADAPVNFTIRVREARQWKASWIELGDGDGSPWLGTRMSWADKTFEVRALRWFLGDSGERGATRKALADAGLR